MTKSIITIGRQYGSGGREIGEKLAKELGIPFYDKELLTIAAKKSGIAEEFFESNDEKPTSSLLYSIVTGNYGGDSLPFNHKLFLAQFDAIRSIAKKGPCVIIGRCADYALEDYDNVVNVFIHADLDVRVKRAIKEYNIENVKVAEQVSKIDKKRAHYYNFYSGRKWGSLENYDLTVDSGVLGIDNTVELIKKFVELKDSLRE